MPKTNENQSGTKTIGIIVVQTSENEIGAQSFSNTDKFLIFFQSMSKPITL